MYNAQTITNHVVSQMMHHMEWKFGQQLWFAGLNLDTEQLLQARQQSPIGEQIATLCRIANGEITRDGNDELAGEVMEMTQSIAETLYSTPLEYSYSIPNEFWRTELGQVIMLAQMWARGDELITISEAAEILYGENTQAARMRVKRMIERGDLTCYVDADESNPQRETRLSRNEVESKKE